MNVQSPLPRDLETQPHAASCHLPASPSATCAFCARRRPTRWWLNGDPVATAWFNALSATFPRGEAFFIEAVKAHREGAPPQLAEEIRSFIIQEVNHSREHVAFNRIATEAGYDMAEDRPPCRRDAAISSRAARRSSISPRPWRLSISPR